MPASKSTSTADARVRTGCGVFIEVDHVAGKDLPIRDSEVTHASYRCLEFLSYGGCRLGSFNYRPSWKFSDSLHGRESCQAPGSPFQGILGGSSAHPAGTNSCRGPTGPAEWLSTGSSENMAGGMPCFTLAPSVGRIKDMPQYRGPLPQ